jgi:hypothetical protein
MRSSELPRRSDCEARAGGWCASHPQKFACGLSHHLAKDDRFHSCIADSNRQGTSRRLWVSDTAMHFGRHTRSAAAARHTALASCARRAVRGSTGVLHYCMPCTAYPRDRTFSTQRPSPSKLTRLRLPLRRPKHRIVCRTLEGFNQPVQRTHGGEAPACRPYRPGARWTPSVGARLFELGAPSRWMVY